jgi:heterogeneous nuclear ribonucleoprotein A1/A3
MAWFNDYSRDYDRAAGYDRGRNPRDTPGMRSSNRGWDSSRGSGFGYDSGWGTRSRWRSTFRGDDSSYGRGGYWGESSANPGYGRDYVGRQYGYGSDYDRGYRRRPPEESPFYGRDADQGVQRWARRYGYDLQYEVNPRQGGSSGGYGANRGGYGGSQRGYGGSGGGYGNRGYRF